MQCFMLRLFRLELSHGSDDLHFVFAGPIVLVLRKAFPYTVVALVVKSFS